MSMAVFGEWPQQNTHTHNSGVYRCKMEDIMPGNAQWFGEQPANANCQGRLIGQHSLDL